MGQNQPFQGETSSNQVSNNVNESIHSLGNEIHDNYLYWTDEMARLMITAISYIADAESFELGNDASSKKVTLMPTMTKWKIISMVMNERGYNVSPQQCEDKFRDIDSKYRQMADLLGSAMSCKVVENPILLDSINMPENQKEEVKKLLSSEQFLYLEMYSFHHGNCFFLSPDVELCRSVFLYLAAISDKAGQNQIEMGQNEMGRNQIVMGQGQYQMGQNQIGMGQGQHETGRNQIEMGQAQYEMGRNLIEMGQGQYETGRNQIEMGQGQYEMGRNQIEMGQGQYEMGQGQYETSQNQNASKVAHARWVELEEKSLEIQQQKLDIEKARFEWLCFKRNEELNLEKMRLDNESQKLQNARLVFELKRREMMSVDENNIVDSDI